MILTYNPTVESDDVGRGASARPSTLDGLTVGLFANGKANGDKLLEALARQLEKQYRIKGFVRRHYRDGPLEKSWDILAEQTDVVLTAVGD